MAGTATDLDTLITTTIGIFMKTNIFSVAVREKRADTICIHGKNQNKEWA